LGDGLAAEFANSLPNGVLERRLELSEIHFCV
jgi:hypothetical protein